MNSDEENTQCEEVTGMRLLQLYVADKLRTEYLRNDASTRENTVWMTLFGYLVQELKERDDILESEYQSVKKNEEHYLSRLDVYIEALKTYAKANIVGSEIMELRRQEIKRELDHLEKKLKDKKDILNALNINLRCMDREIKDLWKVKEAAAFPWLAAWVQGICEQWEQLENEITDIKYRLSRRNKDIIRMLGIRKNLFKNYSLEDLKKVRPFRTVKKQPQPQPPPPPPPPPPHPQLSIL